MLAASGPSWIPVGRTSWAPWLAKRSMLSRQIDNEIEKKQSKDKAKARQP